MAAPGCVPSTCRATIYRRNRMTSVMSGVRVLEVAEYGLAPSAACVLSDWGASVIKVEHPQRGDSIRGLTAFGVAPGMGGFDALWEPFNRGKRSIGIDLRHPEGMKILMQLVRNSDVFITNFLPEARRKLGIDVEHLRAVNPRLVYARASAHGPKGDESEQGGFDGLTFWQRSGAGMQATPELADELVTLPGPGFGDVQAGMALAGGISAALFHRERTGKATTVDMSLLGAGLWSMQASLYGANVSGRKMLPRANRKAALSPLSNNYATSDGRRIALSMLQGDRYWPAFCKLCDREDLATDPRFCDIKARAANSEACIAELDKLFATRTFAQWIALLRKQEGQWAPVQVATDSNDDPQVLANGYVQDVDYGDGRRVKMVASPVQFDETPATLRAAPGLGAQTEEILLEMNVDWEEIARLKDSSVIT
ncbi:CoA transferase [Comamonadaceae bacterium G21597-S1]|nr:CoA transferase [Comamonadaceae bacterium G21597-S1]